MAIDSGLLSDFKSKNPNAVTMFELDVGVTGDITQYKIAETQVNASDGPIDEFVIDSGQIMGRMSDSGFQLPEDTARVRIRDNTARKFEKIFMAAIPYLSKSEARIKMTSLTRAPATRFTMFEGIIDGYGSPEDLIWDLSMSRKNRALSQSVKIPYIQPYQWPRAPEYGVAGQWVYGNHSSVRTGQTGMVKAIYVDNLNYRYMASHGPMSEISAVYSGGVKKLLTTDYTIDLAFQNKGKYYSIITFVADQGDNEITFDCKGIVDNNGDVIRNPVRQIEHFLANAVLLDWYKSTLPGSYDWNTITDVNLSQTHFDAAALFFTDKQTDRASRVIRSGRKGIDVLNSWMKSNQVHSFWTYTGDIALVVSYDHRVTSIYPSTPYLEQTNSPEQEKRATAFPTRKLISGVEGQYLLSDASNKYVGELSVHNPSADFDAVDTLTMPWRESSVIVE